MLKRCIMVFPKFENGEIIDNIREKYNPLANHELHKRLYTGILENHFPEWLKGNVFLPHMTIGSFDNDNDFEKAINETTNIVDSFKTIVNEVSVEVIDENEDSIIELIIPFA